jgi:hypothetical protein
MILAILILVVVVALVVFRLFEWEGESDPSW